MTQDTERSARRVAGISLAANAALAASHVAVGLWAASTSVTAAGVEFAGDVLAAALVWTGFRIAARPADDNHPYGHGRAEIVSGLILGVLLVFTGGTVAVRSLANVGAAHAPPHPGAVWPLVAAMAIKSLLMTVKFRVGRDAGSTSLVADAWNDAVDLLSTGAALTALGLTLADPDRFLAADHFGGFVVGVVVVIIGLRVARESSLELMDTMPPTDLIERIRTVAHAIDGVRGTEKCFARKTGLAYHVDLHLEVDPGMTVADSHEVAERVRRRVRETIPEIADVLVHVEPSPAEHDPRGPAPGSPARQ